MSKYVPSFLKSANRTAVGGNREEKPAAPASSAAPAAAPATFRFFVAKEDPVVVNTSLPARLATPLPPATLASLTITEKPMPVAASAPLEPMRMAARRVPLPTDDDFPTLSKKTPVVAKVAAPAAMSFRELSKDWAQKQKAEAEEAAAKKEKERIAAQEAMKDAARAERDAIRIVNLGLIRADGGSSEEEEEKTPVEDTTEPSDCDDYDDDENQSNRHGAVLL